MHFAVLGAQAAVGIDNGGGVVKPSIAAPLGTRAGDHADAMAPCQPRHHRQRWRWSFGQQTAGFRYRLGVVPEAGSRIGGIPDLRQHKQLRGGGACRRLQCSLQPGFGGASVAHCILAGLQLHEGQRQRVERLCLLYLAQGPSPLLHALLWRCCLQLRCSRPEPVATLASPCGSGFLVSAGRGAFRVPIVPGQVHGVGSASCLWSARHGRPSPIRPPTRARSNRSLTCRWRRRSMGASSR